MKISALFAQVVVLVSCFIDFEEMQVWPRSAWILMPGKLWRYSGSCSESWSFHNLASFQFKIWGSQSFWFFEFLSKFEVSFCDGEKASFFFLSLQHPQNPEFFLQGLIDFSNCPVGYVIGIDGIAKLLVETSERTGPNVLADLINS